MKRLELSSMQDFEFVMMLVKMALHFEIRDEDPPT